MIYLKTTYCDLESDMEPRCCDEDCEELHETVISFPEGFWLVCELHGELEWFDIDGRQEWNDITDVVETHFRARHFQ